LVDSAMPRAQFPTCLHASNLGNGARGGVYAREKATLRQCRLWEAYLEYRATWEVVIERLANRLTRGQRQA
jgi:hypothetical protein